MIGWLNVTQECSTICRSLKQWYEHIEAWQIILTKVFNKRCFQICLLIIFIEILCDLCDQDNEIAKNKAYR